MKLFLKLLLPPIIFNLIVSMYRKKYGWTGNYIKWSDAEKIATGYEQQDILKQVKESLLKVKNGEAVYERDSVIFNEIQYSWQLLTGLMLAATKKNELRIIDFGGSLGSTFFQNIKFLNQINKVSWSIVEQKHFVEIGKKEFEDNNLKFFYTIEECVKEENPSVILFSSVLQYIERPYILLDELLEYNFEYIIIDRTPFSVKGGDKIKLQIVPPSIYKASYPCHFFDEKKFMSYFIEKNYIKIESFETVDGKTDEYSFKGMIWRKNV